MRPRSPEEMLEAVLAATGDGRPVVLTAHPCPGCAVLERLIELNGLGDCPLVVDVPPEDWAIDLVLDTLNAPGAPAVIDPEGRVHGGDPYRLLELLEMLCRAAGP